MALHLDERADGGFALYLDGDFQFDTADEAVYHESLALPALCLAASERPEGLRVLICGGGDGLALRECLRFPGVTQVDLVDIDAEVIALGRGRFGEINRHAFDDPRVHVHIGDAWEFLGSGNSWDVIICDFTVPRLPGQSRIFSREWYERLSGVLAEDGILALNTVSPQTTPEAFWCLHKTVCAAGLSALPYRVCIPSFRAHGYGVWAFLLASRRALTPADLRSLYCPVETKQADLTQLWRGARFRHAERRLEETVPIQTLENDCLLRLLLNPGLTSDILAGSLKDTAPYDLGPLVHLIPITHPYHTRIMIETLAEQVAGTVRELDIRRLVEALLARAARLPAQVRDELQRLRDFLRGATLRWEQIVLWSARLFAALVILMTIANAIAPDNAFAKGSAGLGHASMSRGYSGSFGHSGSFGGEAHVGTGSGRTGASSSFGSHGSFGRTGAFGSRGILASEHPVSFSGRGFRTSYLHDEATDIYGYVYPSRVFHYWHNPNAYTHVNTNPAPETHQSQFVADDDMLVLDNGDVIVTLSDKTYLLVTGGTVSLMSDASQAPLLSLYPDPMFFKKIEDQLRGQQDEAQRAGAARADWLSWTGWTSALFPAVAQDKTELTHLQDLMRRLDTALQRLGQPPATAVAAAPLAAGQVELFVGCVLLPDGQIGLHRPDDHWSYTDGAQFRENRGGLEVPCSPLLASALHTVLVKLHKEAQSDISALDNDLTNLASDRTSLEKDLAEYNSIYTSHGNDGSTEVDYGTDEIPVSDALRRTQNDIDQNQKDTEQTQTEKQKRTAELQQLANAVTRFKQ